MAAKLCLLLTIGAQVHGTFGPFFSAGYGPVGERRVGGYGYGYGHHGSPGYGHHDSGYGHHNTGYGHHNTGYGHHGSGYGHHSSGYGFGHSPGFFHGGPFSQSGYGYHGYH